MKQNWRMAAVLIIVLICVNLVAFIVPFEKTAAFWVSDIFAVIAIAAQYPIALLSKNGRGADLKSRFYGWPIMRVGFFYMVVVLACAVLFTVISAVFSLPVWFVLVVYIIETGACGIGLIAVESARNYAEAQDAQIKNNTKTMKEMKVIADQAVAVCQDAALLKKISKLAENIRYSDPVSNEGTSQIEMQLMGALMQVQSTVESNPEECAKSVDEALRLLELRNKICKEEKNR